MSNDAYAKIVERIIETQFYLLQAVQNRDQNSIRKYKQECDNLIAYTLENKNIQC
jgi:hypothetical protein